jgi:RNA polymerase sigma-70 factor (ECF subfamily)
MESPGRAAGCEPTCCSSVGSIEAVNTPTDEQLLADYVAGQIDGFELLVRRHHQELFRFLVRFTGSSSMAEDIVQETFLQVHLSAVSFDRTRRFKPWLFTIAANKARDLMRSRRRRPEVPLDAQVNSDEEESQRFLDFLADSAAAPAGSMEEEEERAFVRAVMERLPEHLREVLVLSYYHRFPYKEIADILGVPLGTVKSRLHAAVGQFGQAYRSATRGTVREMPRPVRESARESTI